MWTEQPQAQVFGISMNLWLGAWGYTGLGTFSAALCLAAHWCIRLVLKSSLSSISDKHSAPCLLSSYVVAESALFYLVFTASITLLRCHFKTSCCQLCSAWLSVVWHLFLSYATSSWAVSISGRDTGCSCKSLEYSRLLGYCACGRGGLACCFA